MYKRHSEMVVKLREANARAHDGEHAKALWYELRDAAVAPATLRHTKRWRWYTLTLIEDGKRYSVWDDRVFTTLRDARMAAVAHAKHVDRVNIVKWSGEFLGALWCDGVDHVMHNAQFTWQQVRVHNTHVWWIEYTHATTDAHRAWLQAQRAQWLVSDLVAERIAQQEAAHGRNA